MLKKISVVAIAIFFPIICLAQENITIEMMDKIINSGEIQKEIMASNVKTLISDVDLKIKSLERGEFEKKDDYEQRIASSESEMQSLKSKIYFLELHSEDIKNNYDPDMEVMNISIQYTEFSVPFEKPSLDNNKAYCLFPIISSQNIKKSVFNNSYGAKIEGITINETEYCLLFLDSLPGMNTGSGIKKFFNRFTAPAFSKPKGSLNITFSLDPNYAKQIKGDIKIGFFYSVTYRKVRKYNEYSDAKISYPVERFKERRILSIIPIKVVVYNSNNGKILHILQEK